MPTMIYSPGIEVRIATAKHGIVDVSEDISSGSLSLHENSVSNLRLVLTNHMRKYDGMFTPNDRITVKLKRIKWLQVFSGYLNQVPYFSIFPKDVVLTASCTLKRVQYRLWDPGSDAAFNLLTTTGTGYDGMSQVDGGIRDKLLRLLTDVGGWPKANVHIGQIPSDWFSKVTRMSAAIAARTQAMDTQLGTASAAAGVSTAPGTVAVGGAPNTMCNLPATSGKISYFGGVGTSDATGKMALTGESGTNPADVWYCAMRWGYAGYVGGKITTRGTTSDRSAAIKWLKNRRLIVSNPKNGKAIVVRAADWGPGGVKTADDRVIDVSKRAMEALGVTTDGHVNIRWAAEQTLSLGPLSGPENARQADRQAGVSSAPKAMTEAQQMDYEKRVRRAVSTTVADSKSLAGLPFTRIPDNGGHLQPHPHAAREFIKQNWPWTQQNSIGGYSYRTVKNSNRLSKHAQGLALDIGMATGGKMPTTDMIKRGNSIALWFAQNPGAFGITQIIWRNKINTGSGWKTYRNNAYINDLNQGHWNHIHLSFQDGAMTSVGPMGGGWGGSAASDSFWSAGYDAGQGFTPEGGEGGGNLDGSTRLVDAVEWGGQPDPMSALFTGVRTLLNDTYLMDTVAKVSQVGMRNFMSGPNGDFIAWFPDHFDNYKIAAKLHISDVELAGDGFTVQHSDDRLITHQFTAGSLTGFAPGNDLGGVIGQAQMLDTQGVVSIEFPEVMQALFNIDPKHPDAQKFLNAAGILNRYGARNDFQPLGTITGPQAEFWYALKLFTENWAKQFSAAVDLTFMPEAWPGMLLVIDSMKFQAYITGVTHSWNFGGDGFHTQVSIIAPSALQGGLLGLPRAGGVPQSTKHEPRTPALDDD